jgi:hypothetical protein
MIMKALNKIFDYISFKLYGGKSAAPKETKF